MLSTCSRRVLKPELLILKKLASLLCTRMENTNISPPTAVRGMINLEREKFDKRVTVPRLCVTESQLNHIRLIVKQFLLKMQHLNPVRPTENIREILLHPMLVKSWESLPTMELEKHNVTQANYSETEIDLSYQNWGANDILKSILPAENEGFTSFSKIGHIVHLNLRDHLVPHKQLIGDVLLDKIANCRTVVNKAATIDNTYRNFQLELISGEPEYLVETKENGVTFELDFSKVYWNPRLATEHDRITKLLQPNDVLYDVFAGVGPFSVPAAKKRCNVLANDLNPESFSWLQHNAKRNKCLPYIKMFNKDGRDFIMEELRQDLLLRWRTPTENSYNIHITMNLPALAVEFLDAFRGLYTESDLTDLPANLNWPLVHVYSFAKGSDTKSLVRDLVEANLGSSLDDILDCVQFVRNVAPNKDMYRVSFRLNRDLITRRKNPSKPNRKRSNIDLSDDENSNKLQCV